MGFRPHPHTLHFPSHFLILTWNHHRPPPFCILHLHSNSAAHPHIPTYIPLLSSGQIPHRFLFSFFFFTSIAYEIHRPFPCTPLHLPHARISPNMVFLEGLTIKRNYTYLSPVFCASHRSFACSWRARISMGNKESRKREHSFHYRVASISRKLYRCGLQVKWGQKGEKGSFFL